MTDFQDTRIQDAITGADDSADQDPGLPIFRPDVDAPRHSDEYMWNLDAEYQKRLQRFVLSNPHGMELLSGWRNNQHQAELVEDAKAKYGDDWPRYAAAPGKSNHNRGVAADLHYLNDQAKQWAHDNAHLFGLEFPMSWEPWHVEPLGLRTGGYVLTEPYDFTESYSRPPAGMANPALVQPSSVDRSVAMMDTLLSGALPPANAIEEGSEALSGPLEQPEMENILDSPQSQVEGVIDDGDQQRSP